MPEISKELQEKLIEINKTIRKEYISSIPLSKVRTEIEKKINKIEKITVPSNDDIMTFLDGSTSIVGVDGSINTIGLNFPHYISIMQSLAKSTSISDKCVKLADVHTPLIDKSYLNNNSKNLPFEDIDRKICSEKLALLELQAAYDSIDTLKPKIILMDGSLTRYYNASKSKWNSFMNLALKNNIYVLGIIEEIRTAEIVSRIYLDNISNIYDKDLLFGVLEQGEMFVLNDWDVDGICKCFFRTSSDPSIIGIDFLNANRDQLKNLLGIILSLTPKDSRGIPLWLDIVDAEVKLTDNVTKALIENFIDKDIIEKLLKPKRQNRKL